MVKEKNHWSDWGTRFREQIKDKEKNLAKVAETLGRAESTLRSWTNGTREINLAEFFALCTAAEVDPSIVLFGRPTMTEEQRRQLGELATSILEADPAANPAYGEFTGGVRKSVRARKAAESKAPSRLKTS